MGAGLRQKAEELREAGMRQKSEEFREAGGEIYVERGAPAEAEGIREAR
jgi:hypothetical protein